MTASGNAFIHISAYTFSLSLCAIHRLWCDANAMRFSSSSSSYMQVVGTKNKWGNKCTPFFLAMHCMHNFPPFPAKKSGYIFIGIAYRKWCVRNFWIVGKKGGFIRENRPILGSIKESVFPGLFPFSKDRRRRRGGGRNFCPEERRRSRVQESPLFHVALK